jgi:hypothetical protein
MTIVELNLELANILQANPSMRVKWQSRKKVFHVQWKKDKSLSSGEELLQKAAELHKLATGKTYDFSHLKHRVFEKHLEIFI